MKLFKFTTSSGKQYDIVCTYSNTRNGFKHSATLMINNWTIAAATCNYLNRTWESYTYQTAIFSVIDIAVTNEKQACKEEALRETNRPTLRTIEARKAYEKALEQSERLKEYNELTLHFKEIQY